MRRSSAEPMDIIRRAARFAASRRQCIEDHLRDGAVLEFPFCDAAARAPCILPAGLRMEREARRAMFGGLPLLLQECAARSKNLERGCVSPSPQTSQEEYPPGFYLEVEAGQDLWPCMSDLSPSGIAQLIRSMRRVLCRGGGAEKKKWAVPEV